MSDIRIPYRQSRGHGFVSLAAQYDHLVKVIEKINLIICAQNYLVVSVTRVY